MLFPSNVITADTIKQKRAARYPFHRGGLCHDMQRKMASNAFACNGNKVSDRILGNPYNRSLFSRKNVLAIAVCCSDNYCSDL